MAHPASLQVTLASRAELWREIALYLEIWDLIRQGRLEA